MHAEAMDFISRAVGYLGDTSAMRVVEFGAHDVNGSPRALFPKAEYIGVDPWPGSGVDYTCRAQDFRAGEPFDLCISAEALEHDPDARGHIDAAWMALKPGGKLILTAAAEPRAPHRCDGTPGDLRGEHYANIDPDELRGWLNDWVIVRLEHNARHGDVYLMAVKP